MKVESIESIAEIMEDHTARLIALYDVIKSKVNRKSFLNVTSYYLRSMEAHIERLETLVEQKIVK